MLEVGELVKLSNIHIVRYNEWRLQPRRTRNFRRAAMRPVNHAELTKYCRLLLFKVRVGPLQRIGKTMLMEVLTRRELDAPSHVNIYARPP